MPHNEADRRRYRENGWWGEQCVADIFDANAAAHPERLALVDAPNREDFAFGTPRRLTYGDMHAEVERFAGALLAAGVCKRDIIVIQLPNISEFVSLYFAAAAIGAIVSPVAVQYRRHELSKIFEIIAPRLFICAAGSEQADVVAPLLGASIRLATIGPGAPAGAIDLDACHDGGERLAQYRLGHRTDADDLFTICWTSGTTGVPKGVPRTHNQWIAIAPCTYIQAELRDGDVLLNPFPLINMAAIGGITMSWLRIAGTMVLHHPFTPQVYLAQIARERPAFTIAPPAILTMLLQNEALLSQVDLSSLRTIGSGSAPLAPAMVKGFQDRLGLPVINIFGSNEGMSLVSGAQDVPDPVERARYFPRSLMVTPWYGTAPRPIMASRLVPPEGGAVIADDGMTGELQVRSPALFEGYHNATDQSAETFTADGWFRTGDLFQTEQDGRWLRYVGRCKDLIIRGGVNIAPEEIDQLLGGHPDLAEACAFALPDAVMGERIGLAVVPRGRGSITLDMVTAYLRAQDLAMFKWPERLFLFDTLPRNAMNKVMRSAVRDRALAMLPLSS